jgi:hypothetical protein
MLMLLTLLLSVRTSLDVGAADVDAILASAAAGSENIYGTGQCAAPRVTGAAARDCHSQSLPADPVCALPMMLHTCHATKRSETRYMYSSFHQAFAEEMHRSNM